MVGLRTQHSAASGIEPWTSRFGVRCYATVLPGWIVLQNIIQSTVYKLHLYSNNEFAVGGFVGFPVQVQDINKQTNK